MSAIAEIDKSSVFLPEETRVLDKTLQLREDIIDNFIKNGLPDKTNEIRVLNELMNSMDSQVLSKVDKRLKVKEDSNNEVAINVIKELLKKNDSKREALPVNKDLYIDIELDISEVVFGEDKIEYEELSLTDLKG